MINNENDILFEVIPSLFNGSIINLVGNITTTVGHYFYILLCRMLGYWGDVSVFYKT
jgi:hypothetical protein